MTKKLATISSKKFLTNYSLNNCFKHYKKLSIQVCLDSKSPSIGAIKRDKGEDFTEAFIMAWLIRLNEILDLKNSMTEEQIRLCAQEVHADFYSLKIADLTLIFKNIIAGKYGEFYERLNISKVLTIFREYNEERIEFASQQSLRSHNEQKSASNYGELNISKNLDRKLGI